MKHVLLVQFSDNLMNFSLLNDKSGSNICQYTITVAVAKMIFKISINFKVLN